MAFMGNKTRRGRTVLEITISVVVFCMFGASSSSCVRGQTLRQIAKSHTRDRRDRSGIVRFLPWKCTQIEDGVAIRSVRTGTGA